MDKYTKRDLEVAEAISELATKVETTNLTICEFKDEIQLTIKKEEEKNRQFEKRLKELEEFKNRINIYIAGAAAIGGIIVGIISFLINSFDKIKGIFK